LNVNIEKVFGKRMYIPPCLSLISASETCLTGFSEIAFSWEEVLPFSTSGDNAGHLASDVWRSVNETAFAVYFAYAWLVFSNLQRIY